MIDKKMKKKIMNVCGMAFLAISILACSGQKKGAVSAEATTDSVDVYKRQVICCLC